MTSIKDKIKEFPASPGVYQFIGSHGDILYIGKAKNLKNRIKSYFVKIIGRGPSIDIMVSQAKDIKFYETESEIEAVILEADLIRKLKPKHNVRLRDDKSFLVIKITKRISNSEFLISNKNPNSKNQITKTASDQFSCVELVRYKNIDLKDKTADYFGPYPSGLLLKKSLNYLRKVFPYRDCSKTKYATYQKKGRPCIYGDIRVCTAPCAGWIDKKGYNKNVGYLKDFLQGKKKRIVSSLENEMALLSRAKRYEEASLVRDRLSALSHIKDVSLGIRDDVYENDAGLFKRIECYDISNISGNYSVGAMVVFSSGKPDKDEYRKFKIKFVEQPNDLLMMEEMLVRRLKNNWPIPDLIVIDGGETHMAVAEKVLKANKMNIPLVSIAKGAQRKKNEFHFSGEPVAKYVMKDANIQKVIIQARDEAHRFAISYYRSLHKKGMFK